MSIFKKWILSFVAVAIISVLILFAFNYIVDPFGVFGDKFFKWYSYGIVTNPRTGKIAYLDENYEKYNSYIIGGSKSSSISPELLNQYYGGDTSFYSMMMYGGEFNDYEKTVKYLIDNYKVDNIIVHMSTRELAIFNEDPDINNTMNAHVEGTSLLKYYWRFLTLDLKHSIQKLEGFVRRGYDPFEYGYILTESGVYDKSKRDVEINETEEEFIKRNSGFGEYLGMMEAVAIDDNLNCLRLIKEYCDSHGVNFMFVIAPTYDKEVMQFTKDEFDRFLKGVAEITDYWNFSGYTSVGNDARNFYDPLHYSNKIGRMMLARIFDDKDIYVPEDFGYYVTKYNVDDYLSMRPQQPVLNLSKTNINLPVLMYHHIEDEPQYGSYTIISDEKFRSDMTWLKDEGYNTVFFEDVVNYINGFGTLPPNPVVITFDDGYLSNFEYAYPILRELDMKATIFVIGWSVGKDVNKDGVTPIFPHFDWAQAKEMYDSGLMDIQSHTYDLHNDDDNRFGITINENENIDDYRQILKSDSDMMRKLIRENVGNDVTFMAYPYGEYSEEAISVLKELGYSATITTKHGTNNIYYGMYNLFNLNRLNIVEDTTMDSIESLLSQ